jgi:hypothetical protein
LWEKSNFSHPKNLKKYTMKQIVVIFLTALFPMLSMGQSSLGKTDDLGRIAIAAVVPDEAGIPGGAQRMLQNKLNQVATLNGLGAMQGSQFAILPMVSVVSKDVTPTAPPMVSLIVDVTLYIVDAKSQNIFSQTTIQLKGVGNNDERAYTQALNNLNPRHGQFRGFVEKGKEKIVEFYNSQCDVIISSAKALAGQKKYDEALYTLLSVPDVSRECYDKCMQVSLDIYQEYANQQCEQYLAAARAAWAGKDLPKVEENLSKITPEMSCYPKAQELVETVTASVEAEGASAWSYKMKKYDDSVDIEKMKIQAGKEVAQSWAYHGASANFDWAWMYPGAKPKITEQPKAEVQPEKKPVKTDSSEPKPEATNKLGVLTAKVSAYNGAFKGNYHLISDGDFAGDGGVRTSAKCVYWDNPKDVYFVLDLGEIKQINGFNISNHNTDTYVLEWSTDGEKFHHLSTIENSWGRVGGYSDYRMETFSTNPNHKGYEPRIKFSPVKARFIKIYATQCTNCALSEVQMLGY